MGVVLSVGSPVKSHNKKSIPITRRSECNEGVELGIPEEEFVS